MAEDKDDRSPEELEELEKKEAEARWNASIGGDVSTGGGAYIGRDYEIQQSEVDSGRIVKKKMGRETLAFGDIRGSAIFPARGESDDIEQEQVAADPDVLFAPLNDAIATAPEEVREEAFHMAGVLKEEVVKGDQANDAQMAKLIQQLISAVPDASEAVTSIFKSPLLANLNLPVTSFVLDNI